MRYRYNPDIRSLVAMVPAMIPLLLMLIPAMLAALSIVREKELDFGDLSGSFLPLLIAVPVLLGLGTLLLKKQAR